MKKIFIKGQFRNINSQTEMRKETGDLPVRCGVIVDQIVVNNEAGDRDACYMVMLIEEDKYADASAFSEHEGHCIITYASELASRAVTVKVTSCNL